MKHHHLKSGFTPTPILVPFRFLKKKSVRLINLAQELVSLKNDGETKKQHKSWCRGFTLIELLVTLGIFTVMTGVVLANYRTYDTNALFANASEDIVLALRQAQVYGVGVRGESGSFTTSYGVFFDLTTPGQILLFADIDPPGAPDGKYTAGRDKIIETVAWQSPISITDLSCDGIGCSGGLSVTFTRPRADASLYDGTPTAHSTASVTISNGSVGAGLKYSTITISSAGQISLQ